MTVVILIDKRNWLVELIETNQRTQETSLLMKV